MRLDYCGDELSDIAFFSGDKEIPACCMMMDLDDDCCNSQQVFLQDDSDKIQKTETNAGLNFLVFSQGTSAYQSIFQFVTKRDKFSINPAISPPSPKRLYMRFASFLI